MSAMTTFTRTLTLADGPHDYAVCVSPGLDVSRPVACVVFLHGAGECGTELARPLSVGLVPAVRRAPTRWPCVVVVPQKASAATAWPEHEALVLGALEATRAELPIDPERIALTGLSQGGHGTWVLGARHPALFSKLAPICGFGDPERIVPGASRLPIRAFHGALDRVVPASASQAIVQKLRARHPEAEVSLELYPDVDHDAWDRAYDSEDLGPWLTSPRTER
jgi:predicted peptidase